MSKNKILDLLKETKAVQKGHFQLSSGLHSDTYFQCAKLLEQPKNTMLVAQEVAKLFEDKKIDIVVSPAVGGLIIGFAVACQLNVPFIFSERDAGTMRLRRGFELGLNQNVLIVEDVITTGGSALEVAKLVELSAANVIGIGAVVQRADISSPYLFRAVIRMETSAFQQRDCKLCNEGVPLASPGSKRLRKQLSQTAKVGERSED